MTNTERRESEDFILDRVMELLCEMKDDRCEVDRLSRAPTSIRFQTVQGQVFVLTLTESAA